MSAVVVLRSHPTARVFSYWWLRHRADWRRVLVSSVLGPTVYIVVMGRVLGTFVDRGAAVGSGLGGMSYVAFVAPAMVAASAMLLAVNETSFPVFSAFRSERIYAAQFATPLDEGAILGGHLAWVGVRVVSVSAFLTVLVAVVGVAPSVGLVALVPVAVLTGLPFAAWMAAFAAAQDQDGPLLAVLRFVTTPMMLFGGVFFPVEQLPVPLQALARATPLWHGATWSRDLANQQGSVAGAAVHGGYLLALGLVGLWVCRRTYARRLQS